LMAHSLWAKFCYSDFKKTLVFSMAIRWTRTTAESLIKRKKEFSGVRPKWKRWTRVNKVLLRHSVKER
jgi:hypothetical protein